MSAYHVFTKEKTLDKAELAIYQKQVAPTLEPFDVKRLVANGPLEVLEGEPVEGVVITEFQQWKRREHGMTAQRTVTRECTAKKAPSIGACSFKVFRSHARNAIALCSVRRNSAPDNQQTNSRSTRKRRI
jgi:uncharacterized protein (DUF1330 family)